MSIRFKLIMAVMLAAAMSLGSGYLIIIRIAYPHFEAFERQQLLKDIDRVNAVLDSELSALESIARDWGYWNDSYQFAEDRNSAYITTNLTENWLEKYQVDFLRISSFPGGWQQLLNHSYSPIPENTIAKISSNLSGTTGSGVLVVDQQIIMIGFAEIKGSDGYQPTRGQVLFGRLLDPAWVESLGKRFNAEIDLQLVNTPVVNRIIFLDEQLALLETPLPLLNDSIYRPRLQLHESRELSVAFNDSLVMMTLIALAIFGIFALLIYLGLERILIRPLNTIQHRILSITGADSIKAMDQRKEWSSRDELDTLRLLAEEASQIIVTQHQQLRRERDIYEHDSLHDQLTGLYNRRGLERAFKQQFGLGMQPLCWAILDLDHFKRINDTYGHDAGDRVLSVFAELLREVFAESAILSRSGGEEFVVISAQNNPIAPVERLQRLKALVEAQLHVQAQVDNPITLSGGFIQSMRESHWSFGDQMYLADCALYEAKQSRNTLVGMQQQKVTSDHGGENDLSELLDKGVLSRIVD